jgi:Uma2 family endonuclease
MATDVCFLRVLLRKYSLMTAHAIPPLATPSRSRVLPLEPGDHLTREEFERRYDATPGLKKAELIEGVVYMAPAVRWDYHSRPHANLMTWLGVYCAATPGVFHGDNSSIRLDLDNEPQPDAAMIIDPAWGGQSKISADNYLEGAPELTAEVSGSSVSMDLNSKLRVYRRNGVREYIVWRVHDEAIDWFSLDKEQYVLLPRDAGVVRSRIFPGLWLDVPALVRGDLRATLALLQQGISSTEHAEFVKKLESNRTPLNP